MWLEGGQESPQAALSALLLHLGRWEAQRDRAEPENLVTQDALCPARLRKTEGGFANTWQRSGEDLRGAVWYLHLL